MNVEIAAWTRELCDLAPGDCAILEKPVPWGRGVALSLAPHPDDPDAAAVTLRLLAQSGWNLHWAIVTSGWSGVQDEFVGPDSEAKIAAREDEQRASARLFGLPDDRLSFLRLTETDSGELEDTPANQKRLREVLDAVRPDLVILPHRYDTNATHRRVYEWFASWAEGQDRPILALGNEDPKTLDFQPNAQVLFDGQTAQWKASLLECHRSQSVRNQTTRGITFAERILAVNRRPDGTYAERLAAECFRF